MQMTTLMNAGLTKWGEFSKQKYDIIEILKIKETVEKKIFFEKSGNKC